MSRVLKVAVVCVVATTGCDYVFRLDKVHYNSDGGADSVDADLVNGPWKKVVAGDGSTCGITLDDALYCWGQNSAGTLGLGDSEFRAEPTLVPGATWRDVAFGVTHACGIKTDGTAWCWGENSDGQLGNGITDESESPVAVIGGGTYLAIDLGNDVSCGIRESDRSMWCWGDNDYGQLADGSSSTFSATPVKVVDDHVWQGVSIGETHTCGVTTAGAGYCWGTDFNGELGAGGVGERNVPTLVSGGHVWTQISTGWEVSCGVAAGRAYCWGDASTGALGGNSNQDRDVPSPVASTTTDWAEVVTSYTHTCGRTTGGSMWCWGDAAPAGLADLVLAPEQVTQDGTVDAISLGKTHTCRHSPGNAIACIGDGSAGQHGNGVAPMSSPQVVPHPVAGRSWSIVEAGKDNACAIDDMQYLYCWGQNVYAAVGDGTRARRLAPVQISTATGWSELTVGDGHACARNGSGNLHCWGREVAASTAVTPIQIATNLSSATAGRHICAISTVAMMNTVSCWGFNNYGQLGDGSTSPSTTPTSAGSQTFLAVSASYDHTCAIDDPTGEAYCWGSNNRGEGGTGTGESINTTPAKVAGTSTFSQIFAGSFRSCGITAAPETFCWGQNYWGSLGVAATPTPMPIHDFDQWRFLALGDDHTCGLRIDRTLRCWGRNTHGQLGDGTQGNKTSPVPIGGDIYISLAAGADFTCGVRMGGALVCWGSNRDGALGTGHGWTASWIVPTAP